MAKVRLGLDVNTGHAVVVKHLSSELAVDEHARQLFASEAKAAAVLDHPGIVRVLDSGEAEDLVTGISTPYLVMEFIPGHSLTTLTRRRQPVSIEKALELTRHLLDALSYCHDVGLVHGDIKPANVMVMPTGRIKLMDFGLARHADDRLEETDLSPRFLTIRYASPEQVQQAPTDARSDLYSVGCVLYELLTGRPPFDGEPHEVLAHHLFDQPAAPSQYNPDIASDVDRIVLRALEKYPHDRYPSAAAMIADIDHVLEPIQAQSSVTTMSVKTSVRHATELPYLPALTVLARTREVRRRRVIRSISAVAAALLPVAGFGLLHLRGPGEVGGASAARSLGGVVQPRPQTIERSATQQVPPSGVADAEDRVGDSRGAAVLTRESASNTSRYVAGIARSPAVAARNDAQVATIDTESNARTHPQLEPQGPNASGPEVPRPDRPKRDQPSPDKPEPDQAKPDKPKPDKPDQPEPDQPDKPDQPDEPDQPDGPKPDKPDRPKPDKSKPDKPDDKPDRPKPDKPDDKPKPDKPDKPKPDKPEPDSFEGMARSAETGT